MPEYVGFSLQFAADFGPAILRTFFATLRAAVRENWDRHRDGLSRPGPGGEDIDVDSLVAESVPEKMRPSIGDEARLYKEGWITFAFGPVSTYCGLLTVGRSGGGKLFAHLSVCDSEMYRDDMSRLRLREEIDPGFEDPRLLPSPTLDSEDPDALYAYLDRMDEVREENERRFERLYRKREEVWAVNAACLRHIFESLAAALPVEGSRIDEDISKPGLTAG